MNLRVPPQAPEFEKHVIGMAILDKDAAATMLEALKHSDFHVARHSLIFEAISKLFSENQPIDLRTVAATLESSSTFEKAGGVAYLLEIDSEVVSAANIEEYCAVVKEKANLRALVAAGTRILERAYDADAVADRDVDLALADVMGISGGTKEDGLKPWRECLIHATERWRRIAKGGNPGVMSGLRDYDELVGGFQPSQLHLVAARPGFGKSALVLQIARAGATTAVFSLESLAHEQVERAVAQEAGIESYTFRRGETIRGNHARIEAAVAALSTDKIFVCDATTINPMKILTQCRRLKATKGLELVVVDYLQLVQAIGKHERREREIGSISESLKRMANALNIPVIAVASLSRDCERREDKRPVLADLRESGSLESDAHTVTFLYSESKYNRKCPQHFEDVVEINLAKNKNGPTGTRAFLFERKRLRFLSLDRQVAANYRAFVGGSGSGEEF